MLEEYKNLYRTRADMIPDWESLSRTELCNKYIEYEIKDPYLAESYLSAIVCTYWKAIDKYYSSSSTSATPEDCYEWLIHAITYALKARKWLDPSSNVYGDINGPDKVINRCIKSTRLIHYQATNRQKRKLNYNMISLDALEEDFSDMFTARSDSGIDDMSYDIHNMVVDAFTRKDYFVAFFIDGIVNNDVFDKKIVEDKSYIEFNPKKLAKHIRNIDDTYCAIFASRFKLDCDKVKKASKYCTQLSSQRIYTKISQNTELLKRKLSKEYVS